MSIKPWSRCPSPMGVFNVNPALREHHMPSQGLHIIHPALRGHHMPSQGLHIIPPNSMSIPPYGSITCLLSRGADAPTLRELQNAQLGPTRRPVRGLHTDQYVDYIPTSTWRRYNHNTGARTNTRTQRHRSSSDAQKATPTSYLKSAPDI